MTSGRVNVWWFKTLCVKVVDILPISKFWQNTRISSIFKFFLQQTHRKTFATGPKIAVLNYSRCPLDAHIVNFRYWQNSPNKRDFPVLFRDKAFIQSLQRNQNLTRNQYDPFCTPSQQLQHLEVSVPKFSTSNMIKNRHNIQKQARFSVSFAKRLSQICLTKTKTDHIVGGFLVTSMQN